MPTFADLPLTPALLEAISGQGFTEPTPIQAECIPVLVEGRDLVGQSQTGSGKTLAYGLPLLNGLNRDLRNRSLQGLVLCPTRELATQVCSELRKVGRGLPGLRILEVCGGHSGWSQRQALAQGVHVVVGTPGRVLDLIQREGMNPEAIRRVVLDEADRMLDLGFLPQVEQILERLPSERQTAMFSATFPAAIQAISDRWQSDPVSVAIAGEALTIDAVGHVAEKEDRLSALLAVLSERIGSVPDGQAIVFGNFKETVKDVAAALASAGWSVGELHGDLEQMDRDRVMARLRNHSVRVLVATDVAARGIDLVGLDLVVHYEIPSKPEAWVHRSGRTGRAGEAGKVVALVSQRELSRLAWIADSLGITIPAEPLPIGTVAPTSAAMRTLYVGGGRKDKLRPGDILGALTGEGGLAGADIGTIEIHDRFSYVAVASAVFDQAFAALQNGRIKGRRFRVEVVAGG